MATVPTCVRCAHKHLAYEPHAPGVKLYDPWSDPRVNTDLRNR